MSENIIDNKNNINEHDNHDHEYDGIKELNNPSPMWVIILFLITICFSGIYAVKYFGYPNNGMDQASEYKAAVEEQKNKMITMGGAGNKLTEPQMLAAGEKIYKEKGCIACHGAKGEGNAIGPNLSDNFWINGCKPEQILTIITEGKPEKGMTSYKSSLTAAQINQVTVFVLKKLVGSNPANAKVAQGTECK
jgi:cytochrome c oxidase cbb3-type subunit 3